MRFSKSVMMFCAVAAGGADARLTLTKRPSKPGAATMANIENGCNQFNDKRCEFAASELKLGENWRKRAKPASAEEIAGVRRKYMMKAQRGSLVKEESVLRDGLSACCEPGGSSSSC